MNNQEPTVQFVHDTSLATESQIHSFVHCARCIDEKPSDVTPQDWARTQTGWTKKGFQVWCTRHNVNITNVVVRVAMAGE